MSAFPDHIVEDVPTVSIVDTEVSIGLYHDEEIHEAEVSAANGYAHEFADGVEPFFEVVDVLSVEAPFSDAPADWLTLVQVDVSSEMVEQADIRLFHANIDDHLGVTRHTGMTDIEPGLQHGKLTPAEGVLPKMVTKVESARGTKLEFENGLEDMTSTFNPGDVVLHVEKKDGVNVGYTIGRGMTLSDASKLDRESFGPGGKSVTETSYTAVAVDGDEYAEWKSGRIAERG